MAVAIRAMKRRTMDIASWNARQAPKVTAPGWSSMRLVEVKDLISGILGAIPRPLNIALEGVSKEQLTYRPNEHSNTIAWLVWHLTRVQDRIVSSLMDQQQAWVAEGW